MNNHTRKNRFYTDKPAGLDLILLENETPSKWDRKLKLISINQDVYNVSSTAIFVLPGIATPDSKVHGANMGPTWLLSAPDGPHVRPMNVAIWDDTHGPDVRTPQAVHTMDDFI